MTDLRDQLADFEAAARRLLAAPRPRRGLVLVHPRPAACHPGRPIRARSLCGPCYAAAWREGLPDVRRIRRRAEFVADYELLRSEGYTRWEMAERLGVRYDTLTAAYRRAVLAGDLTPDRRTA